jgi:hypothetical protein
MAFDADRPEASRSPSFTSVDAHSGQSNESDGQERLAGPQAQVQSIVSARQRSGARVYGGYALSFLERTTERSMKFDFVLRLREHLARLASSPQEHCANRAKIAVALLKDTG